MEPITALAISMQAKKGTFAVLLGSGVSRSAQIPTGWEIVKDLINRVAASHNEDAGKEPDVWYRDRYDAEPGYSDLLDQLANTRAERSQVIRGYIEPNELERELSHKSPTNAHRAIAQLIAEGYIRVVVTTNFDRLMELALGDVGIVPSVISTADGTRGTLPLAHNRCTIIKIHGDYVDARILNTGNELSTYPDELNAVLDQVFLEYGIIVAGWSGKWDTALRESLLRSKSPWFSTYWLVRTSPDKASQTIIEERGAKIVTNMDADEFFTKLQESVESIDSLAAPELLSVAIAEASLKRYIDDPTKRIRLHDLIVGEAKRVRRRIEQPEDGFYTEDITKETIGKRLVYYEDATSTLRALFSTGCYWGDESHYQNWVDALENLGNLHLVSNYKEPWLNFRYYPALLALYAGGVASILANRYDTLAALLYRPTSLNLRDGKRMPLIFQAQLYLFGEVLDKVYFSPTVRSGYAWPYYIRNETRLWSTINSFLVGSDQFTKAFDRFEYLFGLALVDLRLQELNSGWAPVGNVSFRDYGTELTYFLGRVDAEIASQEQDWPPLKGGLCAGSPERLMAAKVIYDVAMRRKGDY